MSPDERLHPQIQQAIRRYIGYGWGNAIIQDLVRFRFNLRLSSKCLNTFREGGECTAHCQQNCSLR